MFSILLCASQRSKLLGAEKFLRVRFEDLMLAPDVVLRRTADFLGVEIVAEGLDCALRSFLRYDASDHSRTGVPLPPDVFGSATR